MNNGDVGAVCDHTGTVNYLVITYACVVVLSDPEVIVALGAFGSVLFEVVPAVPAVGRACYKQNIYHIHVLHFTPG